MSAVGLVIKSACAKIAQGEHFWNLTSTIASRIISLLLYAIAVRYFLNAGSPAEFAAISLLLLIFSYTQLLDLGIGYAVTQRYGRALATGDPDATRVLSGALPAYILCAGTASGVLLATAGSLSALLFKAPDYASAIRVMAIGVWPLFLSAFAAAMLQAMNRLVWSNVSRTLLELFKATAFLAALTFDDPVDAAITITVCGAFARVLFDMVIIHRLVVPLKSFVVKVSLQEIRLNVSLGWPMVVALVLGILNTSLDRVFVSRVLGAEQLAYYTIAYDVTSKAFFLVGAVGAAVYTPILRRSAMALPQGVLVRASLLSVAVLAICYFLPLAWFAEPILAFWINEEVARQAVTATKVAAIMGVIYLAMSVVFNALQASGRAQAVMVGTIVASGVLVCGLLLMPTAWGAAGVMAVVALCFLSQLLFYLTVMARSEIRTPSREFGV